MLMTSVVGRQVIALAVVCCWAMACDLELELEFLLVWAAGCADEQGYRCVLDDRGQDLFGVGQLHDSGGQWSCANYARVLVLVRSMVTVRGPGCRRMVPRAQVRGWMHL